MSTKAGLISLLESLSQDTFLFLTMPGKNFYWQSNQQKTPWIDLGFLKTVVPKSVHPRTLSSPLLISPTWRSKKLPNRPMPSRRTHVSISSEKI
ncbi:MAG: hypothetical protein PVH03_01845 [Chloroflexota bacterium]